MKDGPSLPFKGEKGISAAGKEALRRSNKRRRAAKRHVLPLQNGVFETLQAVPCAADFPNPTEFALLFPRLARVRDDVVGIDE